MDVLDYDTDLVAFWNKPSSVDLKVIDVNPDLLSGTINREPTTIFDMAVRDGPAVSHLFSTSEVTTLALTRWGAINNIIIIRNDFSLPSTTQNST